jgi:hypothetical protein
MPYKAPTCGRSQCCPTISHRDPASAHKLVSRSTLFSSLAGPGSASSCVWGVLHARKVSTTHQDDCYAPTYRFMRAGCSRALAWSHTSTALGQLEVGSYTCTLSGDPRMRLSSPRSVHMLPSAENLKEMCKHDRHVSPYLLFRSSPRAMSLRYAVPITRSWAWSARRLEAHQREVGGSVQIACCLFKRRPPGRGACRRGARVVLRGGGHGG